MTVRKPKVVCAMSGGVDSSVAAALLLRQGYEVIGCFMRLGTPDGVSEKEEVCTIDSGQGGESANRHSAVGNRQSAPNQQSAAKHKQGCCSVLDAADARRVAHQLGVSFYVLNFQDDFGRVIDYFVGEYNRGRTPNPCVRCNDWLKFGRLDQYAKAVGADFVASGHYARIGPDPVTGEKSLLRGLDHKKDQSYVLFGISREKLGRTLLPIGEFEKPHVRKLAEEFELPTFNKPDSQEICFVPDQDYAGLVKRRAPEHVKGGALVDAAGNVVGEHPGHQHFTIGQRKGVGVAFGYPIYVVDIEPETNRVVLGGKEQLLRDGLVARQTNILNSRLREAGGAGVQCTAKIRYNHTPQPAVAKVTGEDELTVTFDQPQSAITPGQAVVCYDGDVVLGGGWIDRAV
jgi:tRNA-specific 2-thiouridylase